MAAPRPTCVSIPTSRRGRFLTAWMPVLMVAVASVPSGPHGGARAEEPAKWKYAPELMRPFWAGDRVEGESVLFIRDPATGVARASLLFPARKIVSVKSSSGDQAYEEGKDFTWSAGSRELVVPAGSRIVTKTQKELRRPAKTQKYELTHRDGDGEIYFGALLEYHAMQTVVTYEHDAGQWTLPAPKIAAKELPRTIARLKDRQAVTIVLLGDSISSGCNASGWAGGAPHQPPFQDLLREHLAAVYKTEVTLKNPSVGGRDSAWAVTMTDKIIEEKPDLVLLAFGMNDSAGRPAADFVANLEKVMSQVRDKVPHCEFILVAPMLGNRGWVRLKHELFAEYRDGLLKARRPGVAVADLTSIWTEFLKVKQDHDLTGNGVNHPNDFGHRVYAQVLASLLVDASAP